MPDPFDVLERLIAIPSTSGQEGPYARAVAGWLRDDEGWTVDLLDVAPDRPNLLATVDPKPRVVLCTHLDVVPPHLGPRRDGDRMWGRGSADTKGPLVAMVEAARRLRAEQAPVALLLVVGEEVDHCGAISAAKRLDLGRPRIIIGEPTSNRVAVAQKGVLKARLVASGKAAHSAFPDRGTSAVHLLLDHLAALRAEPWPLHPVLGPTTLNVGTIQGGVAANVFAPAAQAVVVVRLVSPAEAVLRRFRELAPPGVEVVVESMNDPVMFEDPPPGAAVCTIPFNSDASFLAPLGPVWLGGPGAIEVAHSDEEHIDRADLEAGVELYLRLARAALGG